MTARALLTAIALSAVATSACEGLSFDAQVGRNAESAPPDSGTPRESARETPPRPSGSPGWEGGSKSVEVPIEGAYDETHSIRFEPPEPRVQAGGTSEVTVVLIGPEAFEPISFLAYSRHAAVAEVPAGAVTFEAGERHAVIAVEATAGPGGSREAVISFETIDFARPDRFDLKLIVEP